MKTFVYYLFGVFSVCMLNACSNEETPNPEPPPSKGQEEVQKIVEVLKESAPQVSQFVEILEQVDVVDLTESELTVFAVKNQNTASRAEVLDTASIKNHIVKGRYAKESLTDGSTLTSISNEKLYVTRTGNEVLINGVQIEGEAIPAGNSYVYVVPEVIPIIESSVTYKHQTTLVVKELIEKNDPVPLEGVTIEAKDGSNHSVGTFTTNSEGTVTISHNCDTLVYRLEKEGYSDLDDGLIYTGIDKDGNYTYKDLNGDGQTNANDKVYSTEWPYQLDYRNNIKEANSTQEHFMVVVNSDEEILKEWTTSLESYNTQMLEMEMKLITGYGGFNYATDITTEADAYYQSAAEMLAIAAELAAKSTPNSLTAQTIAADSLRIKVDLYAYFGNIFGETSEDQLIMSLEQAAEVLDESLKNKVHALEAKVYLLSSNYDNAYTLSNNLNQKGSTDTETTLIAAICAKQLNNIQEACQLLNAIRTPLEMGNVQTLDGDELIETCHRALNGTGNLYPYYRVLNENINYLGIVSGFEAPKNHLLPIPQSVIGSSQDAILQNPGY